MENFSGLIGKTVELVGFRSGNDKGIRGEVVAVYSNHSGGFLWIFGGLSTNLCLVVKKPDGTLRDLYIDNVQVVG